MHWAVKITIMIHGTTVFSTADLNNSAGFLYGKYKYRKENYEVECLEEKDNGTTYCRIKTGWGEPDDYKDLKTDRIYDLQHSDKKIW